MDSVVCVSGRACIGGACVEIDNSPPEISDIVIDPSGGVIGTIFSIRATVTDGGSLSYIRANIDERDVPLFDDGSHNDNNVRDNVYGNIFDSSSLSAGNYPVSIESSDIFNNAIQELSSFGVVEDTQTLCREAIPGHNNPNENRINFIFVGNHYPNLETFMTIVNSALGIEENSFGLFRLEPFRSNMDKFNFWYVNQLIY